jgi:hypothetical protein
MYIFMIVIFIVKNISLTQKIRVNNFLNIKIDKNYSLNLRIKNV